jgi:hypothetical protein
VQPMARVRPSTWLGVNTSCMRLRVVFIASAVVTMS